jgi:hypothetical protein
LSGDEYSSTDLHAEADVYAEADLYTRARTDVQAGDLSIKSDDTAN